VITLFLKNNQVQNVWLNV